MAQEGGMFVLKSGPAVELYSFLGPTQNWEPFVQSGNAFYIWRK